jgi:proliferating cell nuclear antigen PCNA
MKLIITNKCNVEKFINIFRHLKQFTQHITIYFYENRIYAQAMDNSQICLFEKQIYSDWFDHYEYNKNDMKMISLSTEYLFKIMNSREDGQSITLMYEGDVDILNISFESDDKHEYNKYFELRLIELETDLMNVNDYTSQADIVFPTKKIASLIEQLSIFNEVVKIKCDEEEIILKTSGDLGSMAVPVSINDLTEYEIEEDKIIEQSFSLLSLSTICLFQKLSNEVTISLGNGIPLLMLYNLDAVKLDNNDEEPKNYLKFYLAPKIDDDE